MKIEVGTVISNHVVYNVHANAYCIARSIDQNGDYVIWHIDDSGEGVWGGLYFHDQMEAEWAYASRCFPWFEDNVTIALDEDEDDETFDEIPDLP